MGQEPSHPRNGASIEVIGAGLPRTGTTSLALALHILLDGPVYDGGTQLWHGKPSDCTDLISVLQKTPIKSSSDKEYILKTLKKIFGGYMATTDTPSAQFVPELLELWPDAKVICTTRDPDTWAKSIDRIVRASSTHSWFLLLVLFPLPGLRHFTSYVHALRHGRWGELYVRPGDDITEYTRAWYDRHTEWLKSVVPREKLIFYDVRDGWEPLCEALGKEVPRDNMGQVLKFPKLNDARSADEFAKQIMRKGFVAWGEILGACMLVSGLLYLTRRSWCG
ncbi:hypothetical protein CC86DRAFT_417678 [Ophiobolus disseminans]|uniref:NAD dependent epimerase/dehydratase n=1 Tax=Ophiobolus disseminans TaxID=1469910 RepID=A0A6A7A040_9PLEO|nr:hypothetical protein CC86DRAFT_417678 [Ophiobolus disseminans]